jgi:hypothetical protein
MLDKIQTKIDALENGKKLIIGTGIKFDEMQKVVALCEELESQGVIKLVKIEKQNASNVPTLPTLIIEKA